MILEITGAAIGVISACCALWQHKLLKKERKQIKQQRPTVDQTGQPAPRILTYCDSCKEIRYEDDMDWVEDDHFYVCSLCEEHIYRDGVDYEPTAHMDTGIKVHRDYDVEWTNEEAKTFDALQYIPIENGQRFANFMKLNGKLPNGDPLPRAVKKVPVEPGSPFRQNVRGRTTPAEELVNRLYIPEGMATTVAESYATNPPDWTKTKQIADSNFQLGYSKVIELTDGQDFIPFSNAAHEEWLRFKEVNAVAEQLKDNFGWDDED